MASPAELQGSARAVGLPASGGSANAQALGTQDAAVFASIVLSPDGGSGTIESDDDKGMTVFDGWNQRIVNLNTDNYGIEIFTSLYVNGNEIADNEGNLYYAGNGNQLADNNGFLFYGTGNYLADNEGFLYYSNGNRLADNDGTLYYGIGYQLADNRGTLYYSTGNQLADNNGFLYYSNGNTLADASGTLYYSNGNTLADGDGNLTSPSLTINALGGNSVFLGAFTTADLPSASGNRYAYLVCTDGGTGSTPVPRWSDGTSWRKFTIV
jgi:hypothetical protein